MFFNRDSQVIITDGGIHIKQALVESILNILVVGVIRKETLIQEKLLLGDLFTRYNAYGKLVWKKKLNCNCSEPPHSLFYSMEVLVFD